MDNLVYVDGESLKVIKLISSEPHKKGERNKGSLYKPKDLAEVRSRAKVAGERFFQIFANSSKQQ